MLNIKVFKENRKKLKLNQIDLSDIGISREYISDVERGKSILTVNKAKVLLNKLLFFSMSKEIFIDLQLSQEELKSLEMDSILEIYAIYFTVLSNKNITSEIFNKLQKCSKLPLGDYLFFINKALYIIYYSQSENELAYNHLNNAIHIAFLSKNEIKYFSIYDNLALFRSLAFTLYRTKDIIDYYQKILMLNEKNKIDLKPFTYYNLALFEKMGSYYKDSLIHLNKELELNNAISLHDLLDLQIMKAGLYFKLGEYKKGIIIYQQILIDNFAKLNKQRQTLVASNLIHFIIYYKLNEYDELADRMVTFILETMSDTPNLFSKRFRVYGNLGQYYRYKDNFNYSLDYFHKAFEIYHSNHSEINREYFNLLSESFITFFETNNINTFLENLSMINFNLLGDKLKILYLENLCKFLYHNTDRENNLIKMIIDNLGPDMI